MLISHFRMILGAYGKDTQRHKILSLDGLVLGSGQIYDIVLFLWISVEFQFLMFRCSDQILICLIRSLISYNVMIFDHVLIKVWL